MKTTRDKLYRVESRRYGEQWFRGYPARRPISAKLFLQLCAEDRENWEYCDTLDEFLDEAKYKETAVTERDFLGAGIYCFFKNADLVVSLSAVEDGSEFSDGDVTIFRLVDRGSYE